MITINLTPTMLTIKDLTDEMFTKLMFVEKLKLKYDDKGYYYIKGTGEELYKILLKLTYTYDIELT